MKRTTEVLCIMDLVCLLLWDRGMIAQPGQIWIAGRGLMMCVVAACKRRDGTLIFPAVVGDMAIAIRNDTASAVCAAWEVEKRGLVHANAEVRPTNALRVNVLKKKNF